MSILIGQKPIAYYTGKVIVVSLAIMHFMMNRNFDHCIKSHIFSCNTSLLLMRKIILIDNIPTLACDVRKNFFS